MVDHPETIWKKTEKKSGINKLFFDKYFENREQAVAYKLKNVRKYVEPKELKEYGIRNARSLFSMWRVSLTFVAHMKERCGGLKPPHSSQVYIPPK